MKKLLFLVCAMLCIATTSSAKFKPKPFEWKAEYRGEVNIGGAMSGTLYFPPQENIYLPGGLKTSLSRPLIETVHGVMLSDYLFVGAGLGIQYYAGEFDDDADEVLYIKEGTHRWNMLTIPMFVNIKGFFPINDNWKPFMTLSLGGTAVACSNATFTEDYTYYDEEYDALGGHKSQYQARGGFYCDWGVGVEYKRWSLGIGLQHQRYKQTDLYTHYDAYSATSESGVDKLKGYSHAFYVKLGVSF